jgi:hypothetical protein
MDPRYEIKRGSIHPELNARRNAGRNDRRKIAQVPEVDTGFLRLNSRAASAQNFISRATQASS